MTNEPCTAVRAVVAPNAIDLASAPPLSSPNRATAGRAEGQRTTLAYWDSMTADPTSAATGADAQFRIGKGYAASPAWVAGELLGVPSPRARSVAGLDRLVTRTTVSARRLLSPVGALLLGICELPRHLARLRDGPQWLLVVAQSACCGHSEDGGPKERAGSNACRVCQGLYLAPFLVRHIDHSPLLHGWHDTRCTAYCQ